MNEQFINEFCTSPCLLLALLIAFIMVRSHLRQKHYNETGEQQ